MIPKEYFMENFLPISSNKIYLKNISSEVDEINTINIFPKIFVIGLNSSKPNNPENIVVKYVIVDPKNNPLSNED